MARARIKFAWKPTISGREKWHWGLWMKLPSSSRRKGTDGGIKIMVRGLLIWGFSLATIGYLAMASAWFYMLDQRPSNLVTWTDCVMAPLRWTEIRHKRGDGYIAEGLAAMEARKWNEAILKIEAGLAVSPNNRQGRKQLGLFFVVVGQRERGLAVLADGFGRYYPGREDLELFLRLAIEGEDFDQAIGVVGKSLTLAGRAVERDEPWIRDQMLRVLMLGERYADAVEWIRKQETRSELMNESLVVAFIELKDFESARSALDAWQETNGRSNAVQRIRVRLAREERSIEEMRSTLAEMRSLNPNEPQSWVYAVIQEYLAGEKTTSQQELESFLLRFGVKEANLRMLADPLVEIEAWEMFDQISERYEEMRFASRAFAKLRTRAAMARNQYEEARQELHRYATLSESPLTEAEQRWHDTNSALVEYLLTGEDSHRGALVQGIQSARFSIHLLKSIAEKLVERDAKTVALEVVSVGRQRFPNSTETNRIYQQLQGELGKETGPEVEIPLVQDGTPLDLNSEILSLSDSEEVPLAVRSATQFLAQSDLMISEERWSELSDLLREVRRARPSWANNHRQEISSREISLNIAEKNWPALVTTARFLLDGTIPRALEVMNIVRELDNRGERQAAETLLDEVERRHSAFPPARRLREDWAKAAAASTEAAETESGGEASSPETE